MATFYISFASAQGFLGGLIVKDVPNMRAAHKKSWDLAQNPGDCEAGFAHIDDDVASLIPPEFINCLMSRERIEEFDRRMDQICDQ
jgi:hypothetical protein